MAPPNTTRKVALGSEVYIKSDESQNQEQGCCSEGKIDYWIHISSLKIIEKLLFLK